MWERKAFGEKEGPSAKMKSEMLVWGPWLLPPSGTVHLGSSAAPGMGDRARRDSTCPSHSSTLLDGHWERAGWRRLPGRRQGLANQHRPPGLVVGCTQWGNAVLWWWKGELTAQPHLCHHARWRHLVMFSPHSRYIKDTQVGMGFSRGGGRIPPFVMSFTTILYSREVIFIGVTLTGCPTSQGKLLAGNRETTKCLFP